VLVHVDHRWRLLDHQAAIGDHAMNPPNCTDVLERVAIQDHEIRELPAVDRAQRVRHTDIIRRRDGGSTKRGGG
jgi:hypothetical protein